MLSPFSEQIPKSNIAFKLLPLFHTCPGVDAGTYIKKGKIVTEDVCEVFDERITYLFYGRPSYKYALPEGTTDNVTFYACSFILRPDAMSDIKRIFPFDTGALHHDMLSRFIHPKMKEEFALEPDVRRIADVVLRFHGTNENYLSYKVKDVRLDALDFHSEAFLNMHDAKSWDRTDERRVTIEVQAGETIELGKDILEAMILPRKMMASKYVAALQAHTNVQLVPYDPEGWDPKFSFLQVMQAAKAYLKKRKRRRNG